MSDAAVRIDLAHEQAFVLGRLIVRPSTREVVRDDGEVEVLEPRVMQVLVALHRAGGAIVSRHDLTQSCWEGRVVGEDAINRVISRLRRTAGGIGEEAFGVETVTKVGYRLRRSDRGEAQHGEIGEHQARPALVSRRVIGGGALLGMAALGGGGWLFVRRRDPDAPPASVAGLMTQAEFALYQDTREGQNQAIGLYQQAVANEPTYADGWGALSIAYAFAGHYRATAESLSLNQRARSAAARALALDPRNSYGQVGLAIARPKLGSWLDGERTLRSALVDHPDHAFLLFSLGTVLSSVGRLREACEISDRIVRLHSPNPDTVFTRIVMLWGAGRQEECDRLMVDGGRLYPTHFAVWFSRFYVLLYTGRPGAALALAADGATLPTGISEAEIESIVRVAQAAQSRDPAAIDAVMTEQLARAHQGTGLAENAFQFACLLGRIDDAFAIAEAYYLDRGWVVPDIRFTAAQGTYLPRGDRLTHQLFDPSTAPMRTDRRFQGIVRGLGLEDYWRASATEPDYRRYGSTTA